MTIQEWDEQYKLLLKLETYESVTGKVAQAILDLADVVRSNS